jgi:hypothetical protein
MPPKSSEAARVSTPLLFPITSAILVSPVQTPRHLRPFFTAPLTLLIFSYDSARQSKGWSFSPPYHLCLPVACAPPTTADCSHVSLISTTIPSFIICHITLATLLCVATTARGQSLCVTWICVPLLNIRRPSLTIVIRECIKTQDVPRNLKSVVLREPSQGGQLRSTGQRTPSLCSGRDSQAVF